MLPKAVIVPTILPSVTAVDFVGIRETIGPLDVLGGRVGLERVKILWPPLCHHLHCCIKLLLHNLGSVGVRDLQFTDMTAIIVEKNSKLSRNERRNSQTNTWRSVPSTPSQPVHARSIGSCHVAPAPVAIIFD